MCDKSQLNVRLPQLTLEKLDAAAPEQGLSRSRFVRRLVEGAVAGEPLPVTEPPTAEELTALLAEKARGGNVAAIRTRLTRAEAADPRAEALRVLEAMAEEWRQ